EPLNAKAMRKPPLPWMACMASCQVCIAVTLGGGEVRPSGRLGRCGKSTGPRLTGGGPPPPPHSGGRQICANASAGPRTTTSVATATNFFPSFFITLSFDRKCSSVPPWDAAMWFSWFEDQISLGRGKLGDPPHLQGKKHPIPKTLLSHEN